MKDLKTFLNESLVDLSHARRLMIELISKVFVKYRTDRVDINELMKAICSIGWTYDNRKSTDTQLSFYLDIYSSKPEDKIYVNIDVKKYGNEVEMVDYAWEDTSI